MLNKKVQIKKVLLNKSKNFNRSGSSITTSALKLLNPSVGFIATITTDLIALIAILMTKTSQT